MMRVQLPHLAHSLFVPVGSFRGWTGPAAALAIALG